MSLSSASRCRAGEAESKSEDATPAVPVDPKEKKRTRVLVIQIAPDEYGWRFRSRAKVSIALFFSFFAPLFLDRMKSWTTGCLNRVSALGWRNRWRSVGGTQSSRRDRSRQMSPSSVTSGTRSPPLDSRCGSPPGHEDRKSFCCSPSRGCCAQRTSARSASRPAKARKVRRQAFARQRWSQ